MVSATHLYALSSLSAPFEFQQVQVPLSSLLGFHFSSCIYNIYLLFLYFSTPSPPWKFNPWTHFTNGFLCIVAVASPKLASLSFSSAHQKTLQLNLCFSFGHYGRNCYNSITKFLGWSLNRTLNLTLTLVIVIVIALFWFPFHCPPSSSILCPLCSVVRQTQNALKSIQNLCALACNLFYECLIICALGKFMTIAC